MGPLLPRPSLERTHHRKRSLYFIYTRSNIPGQSPENVDLGVHGPPRTPLMTYEVISSRRAPAGIQTRSPRMPFRDRPVGRCMTSASCAYPSNRISDMPEHRQTPATIDAAALLTSIPPSRDLLEGPENSAPERHINGIPAMQDGLRFEIDRPIFVRPRWASWRAESLGWRRGSTRETT
jgi:hypothetical protein